MGMQVHLTAPLSFRGDDAVTYEECGRFFGGHFQIRFLVSCNHIRGGILLQARSFTPRGVEANAIPFMIVSLSVIIMDSPSKFLPSPSTKAYPIGGRPYIFQSNRSMRDTAEGARDRLRNGDSACSHQWRCARSVESDADDRLLPPMPIQACRDSTDVC